MSSYRLNPGFSAISLLSGIGRAAMDFGLGAYLEKFEQHFGVRWTKYLLIIVGITIVISALAAITKLALVPLWFLLAPQLPADWTLGSIFRVLFITLQIGAGVGFGSILLDAYRRRLATDALEHLVPDAREAFDEAKKLYEENLDLRKEMRELIRYTSDAVSAAKLTSDKIVQGAVEKGYVTQEEADLLRSLQDIVEETPQ